MADNDGRIDTNASVTEVSIPKGATIDPSATTLIVLQGNLDSRDTGRLTYSPSTVDITVGGETTQVTFTLIPTGNFNEFEWSVTATDGTFSVAPSGTLRLDAQGNVASFTGPTTFDLTVGSETITFYPPGYGGATNSISPGNMAAPHWQVAGAFEPAETRVTTIEVFDSLGRLMKSLSTSKRSATTMGMVG